MLVEDTFVEAANDLKLCELTDTIGNKRLVEPYMVFTSNKRKRLFHCFQIEGYSESGRHTWWKNMEIGLFTIAVIHDETFNPREGYNPFNFKKFPVVHFSIPTIDGRQRWN